LINIQPSISKLIIPSLFVATYAAQIGGIITSLLLIDIGETFNLSVGVAGQLKTVSSGIAVIFSIIMGIISIRYNHKTLIMTGILLFIVSSIGCYLSPNFNLMLASYAIAGVGIAVYGPMSTTIIGEILPAQKRAGAIGIVVAGMSISYLVGALVVGYLSGASGWRSTYLLYAIPISILSLIMVAIGIPSKQVDSRILSGSYFDGFKAVLTNISADSCLICYVLSSAAWQYSLAYSISFVRQRFLLTRSSASIFMLGTSLVFTIGSVASGRIINRYGRKFTTVISTFLLGVLTIIGPFLYNFGVYSVLALVCCVFGGIMFTGIRSLTLEQVPRFRGTIMSLNYASMQLGYALGAGIGGFALVFFDYQGAGLALGGMGVIGALLLYLYAIEPKSE
jgi:predicted MFS family arabinose efflux permease